LRPSPCPLPEGEGGLCTKSGWCRASRC